MFTLQRIAVPPLSPYTTLFRSTAPLTIELPPVSHVVEIRQRNTTRKLEIDVKAGQQTGRRLDWSDRKSTRLNSSHRVIAYAGFCLTKRTTIDISHKRNDRKSAI